VNVGLISPAPQQLGCGFESPLWKKVRLVKDQEVVTAITDARFPKQHSPHYDHCGLCSEGIIRTPGHKQQRYKSQYWKNFKVLGPTVFLWQLPL
jgi:hypothetical protein